MNLVHASLRKEQRRVDLLQQRQIVGMQLDIQLGGILHLRASLLHRSLDHLLRDGQAADQPLRGLQRQRHQGALTFAGHLRHGITQGGQHTRLQLHHLGTLLNQLRAEVAFPFDAPAFEAALEIQMEQDIARAGPGQRHLAHRNGERDVVLSLHCPCRNRVRSRLRFRDGAPHR